MLSRSSRRAALPALALLLASPSAHAQLSVISTFNPSTVGPVCGLGFDETTGEIWLYGCGDSHVDAYSSDGTYQSQIPVVGGITNDVDIEFAPETLTLNGTEIAAGTMLFINGEVDAAEIYAVDKRSGKIIETLDVAFGSSHVVGGAYHPDRDTFFLIQDRNGGALANTVAEIDPQTGAVVDTFSTIAAGFDVNFGDLDVDAATGNLLIVSSAEMTIAEFMPDGTLVQELDLPAGLAPLSGLGIDDSTGALWVATNTTGQVWQLEGETTSCPADLDGDDSVGFGDLTILLGAWGPCVGCQQDLDGDDLVGFGDLTTLLGSWGPCP